MVYLSPLEKALWGTAFSVILSRSTAEAKIGIKVPTVQVDVPRFGPQPANEDFSVEVPVFSDAKTIRTSVDAILEGIELFRPGEKQLRRASTYDEVELLRSKSEAASAATAAAALSTPKAAAVTPKVATA
ncbi:hypothetical protein Emag_001702 [Eimeria magna]